MRTTVKATAIFAIVNRQSSIVILLLGLAAGAVSQEIPKTPPIRIESALVSVPVMVTDSEGRFLPGLKAGDFNLFQDGIPEQIALFLTSEDPVKIALLLDTSKSTIIVLDRIKRAARSYLKQMRPQDLAMVVSFDSEVQVLCPLSSDSRELEGAIRRAKVGGYVGTRMRDAVFEVAQRRFKSITGRKAIVLLTDGQDYGSQISSPELLDAIAASSTMIYSIFYSVDPRELMKKLFGVSSRLPPRDPRQRKGPYALWNEREQQAAQYLRELSELSAGRFYGSDVTDLDKAFAQISDELRAQYLLGFYPDESKLDGDLHALEVRLTAANGLVRSRRSYRATK